MAEVREIGVLALTINGKRVVYAAPLDGRDPMEMTLGEWKACPALSAVAIVNDFLDRRAIKDG